MTILISYFSRQHALLHSSLFLFRILFVSMFVSYCIRHYSYFVFYSSACSTAFVIILISYSSRQHVLLHSSLFLFRILFVSMFVSCYILTNQHSHFLLPLLYSSACLFQTTLVCMFISYRIRQHVSFYCFRLLILYHNCLLVHFKQHLSMLSIKITNYMNQNATFLNSSNDMNPS